MADKTWGQTQKLEETILSVEERNTLLCGEDCMLCSLFACVCVSLFGFCYILFCVCVCVCVCVCMCVCVCVCVCVCMCVCVCIHFIVYVCVWYIRV